MKTIAVKKGEISNSLLGKISYVIRKVIQHVAYYIQHIVVVIL